MAPPPPALYHPPTGGQLRGAPRPRERKTALEPSSATPEQPRALPILERWGARAAPPKAGSPPLLQSPESPAPRAGLGFRRAARPSHRRAPRPEQPPRPATGSASAPGRGLAGSWPPAPPLLHAVPLENRAEWGIAPQGTWPSPDGPPRRAPGGRAPTRWERAAEHAGARLQFLSAKGPGTEAGR